jgi:hypothetical protein
MRRELSKAEVEKYKNDQELLEKLLRKDSFCHHDEHGREIMDPTPVAPPVGYKKQPSMVEIVRDMVRSERLKQEAESAGFESFEEADDFDTGEDLDPYSPYEDEFEPEAVRAAHEAAEQPAPNTKPGEAVAQPASTPSEDA